MGQKSSKSKSSNKVKIAVIAAFAVMVLLAGGLVYASYTKSDFIIPLKNSLAFGIWFGPRGEPHVNQGRYGCCSPYCTDMFEIECSQEYGYNGTFTASSCQDVPECRQGCCLPDCHEVAKVQCEGDYGFGDGGWLPQACQEVPECEIGCCNLDGVKRQEMKAPCEATSGTWTQGVCKIGYTVDATGTDTLSLAGIVDQTFNATIHMYTCGDTIDGLWNARVDGSSDTTSSKGTKHSSNTGTPFSFEVENGTFGSELNWGGDIGGYFKGTLTESQATINYAYHLGTLSYDINSDAPVKPGAAECEEQ
jgi:hypothetical protein